MGGKETNRETERERDSNRDRKRERAILICFRFAIVFFVSVCMCWFTYFVSSM